MSLKIYFVCVTWVGLFGFIESRIDEDVPSQNEESFVIREVLKRMEQMESKLENVLAENEILRNNQQLHTEEIQQLKMKIQRIEENSIREGENIGRSCYLSACCIARFFIFVVIISLPL